MEQKKNSPHIHIWFNTQMLNLIRSLPTLKSGTAWRGCSPMHTRSTPMPVRKIPLTSTALCYNTNSECTAHSLTVVNHALFGEDHEQAVHLEHTHSWSNDHWHLARTVKVTVDVVLIKDWKRQNRTLISGQTALLECCGTIDQIHKYKPLKDKLIASR